MSDLSPAEIRNRFSYHSPNPFTAEKYENIRDAAGVLARLMVASCPDSRELSLAITNLEQSVMWANAAIARRRDA